MKSTRITAIYQGLQALYSPNLLPPGGAGVTSGKNQLISGSGVAIYQEHQSTSARNGAGGTLLSSTTTSHLQAF